MRMLELLYWKYNTISSILSDIKNQGFDTIKIGPILSVKEIDSFDWKDYNEPISLNIKNKLGGKEELKYLCDSAEKLGIKIITDVNIEHAINKYNIFLNNDLNEENLNQLLNYFISEISICNVDGINTFISKKDIYILLKELLNKYKLSMYDNNIDYINPIFDSCVIGDKKIAYLDNINTFLYNKKTSDFSIDRINTLYSLTTYAYQNTMYYPRCIYYPYNEFGSRRNDFGIHFDKINELDYFDNSFLINEDIKSANSVKVKNSFSS